MVGYVLLFSLRIAMWCVTMQDGGEVIYHSSLEEHMNLNSQLVDGHVRTSRV
jgi:hypothetical protein